MGIRWDQHLHSISSMLQLSYQNKQPMTPSAFFDQLARQVGPLAEPDLAPHMHHLRFQDITSTKFRGHEGVSPD